MTSYVKQGHNTYNGVEAPEYNILSYTWGYYQDPASTEALVIHGVDWPIPRIKADHFTVADFQNAIQRAAQGYRRRCEWLWVDVACIPQQHGAETHESVALRGQEIGRQVEIFQRAQEAFAWLSSIQKADVTRTMVTVMDMVLIVNSNMQQFPSEQAAYDFLQFLDRATQSFERWMTIILEHPWFQSLWTLQEMVLRPDAWILLDDGPFSLAENQSPWNFIEIKTDTFTLRGVLERLAARVKSAELLAFGTHSGEYLALITKRLEKVLALQEDRGLDALDVKFPYTAYSLAQRRRVTHLKDRIYGIVQTYGISCTQFPRGEDEVSQLHALQDEFGTKLVARSPLLSQLFIHTLVDCKPRRSWLITQDCKADDKYWEYFTTAAHAQQQVQNEFKQMTVVKTREDGNIQLRLESKSWSLKSFVESCSSAPSNYSLFRPARNDTTYVYRGLMLDYHVSKSVVGRVVDYFDSLESMSKSVEILEQYYHQKRRFADGGDANYAGCLRIALLGSGHSGISTVYYVGLVLAPMGPLKNTCSSSQPNQGACAKSTNTQHPGPVVWERIGLMRWTETYSRKEEAPHQCLPPYHDSEYLVV